jgi:hypothetical protein
LHNFNTTDILPFASLWNPQQQKARPRRLTRRRVKIFDRKRVPDVYAGSSAIRGSPEAYSLESGIGRSGVGKS